MTTVDEKVLQLEKLHQKEKPLILLNIWNRASATELKNRQINLLGTSSYAVADSRGYQDGEELPFAELVADCREFVSTETILTVDIETGYADSLIFLEKNIQALLNVGVSGINIEDRITGTEELLSIQVFTERLKCIQATCKKLGQRLFVNARSDVYFTGNITAKNQDESTLIQVLERIKAYQQAGADGIFLPGLENKEHIQRITSQTTLPLNLMLDIKKNDLQQYLNLGVSRFSFGPSIYLWYQEENQELADFYEMLLRQLNSYVEKQQITLF